MSLISLTEMSAPSGLSTLSYFNVFALLANKVI
jgi:hypothetical protein